MNPYFSIFDLIKGALFWVAILFPANVLFFMMGSGAPNSTTYTLIVNGVIFLGLGGFIIPLNMPVLGAFLISSLKARRIQYSAHYVALIISNIIFTIWFSYFLDNAFQCNNGGAYFIIMCGILMTLRHVVVIITGQKLEHKNIKSFLLPIYKFHIKWMLIVFSTLYLVHVINKY